jgi:hypothetical protein
MVALVVLAVPVVQQQRALQVLVVTVVQVELDTMELTQRRA